MKVYKQGAFVVIETPTQKTIIPRASFDFDPIGQTGTVRMRSIEDTFQGISEVFSNIKKEDGTPAGVDLDAVLSYLSELPVEGGSGGGSVTITGDDVGLARKTQFDTKYTGFVIDLANPESGSWPEYTFNIEQINFELNTSPTFEISDFGQTYDNVRNTKELAEYLNCIQNYFYFVDVSPTLLGIMAGKLPISEFNNFKLNANGEILEYNSGGLLYQVATEELSTQDKIIQALEQNAQKQNAPKGLATRREEKPFPASGLLLSVANMNPFREELIVRNNSSTNNLYVGYGSSTSSTNYTFLLEPSKVLRLTAGHRVTAAWEAGSTSGTILITESI